MNDEIPIAHKLPELDFAIKAVKEAGEAILKIYHGEFEKSKKLMILQLQMRILRVMRLSKKFSQRQNM